MEAEYLKCHHGNELRFGCHKCEAEKRDIKKSFYTAFKEQEKDKRIPILRGCPVLEQGGGGQCFCTGRCNDIVGYYK